MEFHVEGSDSIIGVIHLLLTLGQSPFLIFGETYDFGPSDWINNAK